MMPDQLLVDLAKRQVSLFLEDDHLRFRSPPGALTPDLRAVIAEHRTEIIEQLRGRANTTTVRSPRCVSCHRQYWIDEPPRNGRIRTTCGQCGRFVGYRPKD